MAIGAFNYDKKKDPYITSPRESSHVATKVVQVIPDDNTDLPVYAKTLYIGVSGNLQVIPVGQTTPVTYWNHPVGYFIGCRVGRVCALETTADKIMASYD